MDFGIKSDVHNLVIFFVNLNTAGSCIFWFSDKKKKKSSSLHNQIRSERCYSMDMLSGYFHAF